MSDEFRISETTALLDEIRKLKAENARLRDELTAADLICELVQRELNDIKMKERFFH